MMTLDRINALRKHFGLTPLTAQQLMGCGHDALNYLDRWAGIGTRLTYDKKSTPVGARIARLERHIERQKTVPYFWLGAAAEDSDYIGSATRRCLGAEAERYAA